jgi:Amiloride-sensitive sodium channel
MREKCPRRCKRRSFKTNIMTSKLNRPVYTEDDVLMEIYYDRLKRKKYTEQLAMDLAIFVANLGGIIGSWTGMSSITFTQLLIFAIAKMCQLLHRALTALTAR